MNNNRFCSQKGHEQVQTTHQCIFDDCNLLQRQCCGQCINEGIHNHGKADQEHIKLEQKLPQVENDKDIKPIDLSKREYKVKAIDQVDNNLIADISEKYLAYGVNKKIFKIYDLKEDRIIKELEINGRISAIQFSFDSSQLYVAFWNNIELNIIIGFDVEKNFKKIFRQCVITSEYIIKTIITIQKQYLITRDDCKTRKIDIKRNKQIFKLIDDIKTIDYNQQYDVIITGCQNGSIKLLDFGKRSVIINKENAHYCYIEQIQLINNIQNVLSLDEYYNLSKWSVDLINKKLIKLQEYKDRIYSFFSINQNQNLLLICQRYVKIVDDKGKTIKQLDFMCGDDYYPESKSYRQLDNAKYIYVTGVNYDQLKAKIILFSAIK